MWAEWYRHLAEAGIPPDQQMPRDLWTWEVDPGLQVADLTSEDRLERVGLAMPRPGRQTWAPYQRIGETLWREGWQGLLAPSAARPHDGLVLCLFRGAKGMGCVRPVSPPRVIRRPPAPPMDSSPTAAGMLEELRRVVAERAHAPAEESYTARLLARGPDQVLKKVGEEATEVVLAARVESDERLAEETADLLYHHLVALHQRGLPLARVMDELRKRRTR